MKPLLRAPILAILVIEFAVLVARAFLETRLIDGGLPNARDLSYLVVPPLLIVLMYPILRQHGQFLLSLLRRQDLTLRLIVLSVTLGITLRIAYWGGLISVVSFGVLHNDDPDAVIGPVIRIGCPEANILALSFLIGVILTPLIEETINRGLILQSLIHRGKILAIASSSFLFAIAHNPQAMLLAFLIGLFLAAQLINHKTLWAPIITHASYNAVSILDWECMSTQWNPLVPTPSMTAIGLIAATLTAFAVSFSAFTLLKNGHRRT
jgi:membrane protease YdiL (CAAX protease family)